MNDNLSGVFLSQQDGLCLLVLPKAEDLNKHWADLRKFALDSDLILGAIVRKNDEALVIVGRERQTSLSAMPPLRAETILTLAATTDVELRQSIEGQHILAGKIDKGKLKDKDWALAVLSENLIDTELGSLLYMTDELLKSWSEAGNTEIVNFPYPKPQIFPFKGQPLTDRTGATKVSGWSLTYNWNTAGLGTVYDFGDYDLFAVTKTGSLPVSYLSNDLVKSGVITNKELVALGDEGYDYFSQRRNVHMTQVAQYAALYQIFRAFRVNNVSWKNQVKSQNIALINNELKSQVLEALQQIETGDVQLPELENELKAARETLYYLQEDFGPDSLKQFATYLADPDRFLYSPEARIFGTPIGQILFYQAQIYLYQTLEKPYRALIRNIIDKDKVLNRIVIASEYEPASNIKTPTVSVSKYRGKEFTGGHNLDSAITKIVVDPSQSKGNVGINKLANGTTELRIHPNDAVNSPSIARYYSRNQNSLDGQQQFKVPFDKTPPRPINKALEVNRGNETPGLSLKSEVPRIAKGFQTSPVPLTPESLNQMIAFAKEQNLDLVVKYLPDGFVIYQGHPPGTSYLPSSTALIEYLYSGGSRWKQKSGRLYFQDFPEGSGSVPPNKPPNIDNFTDTPEARRWNFNIFPKENGQLEVLSVSRKQQKRDESVPFARRLQDRPDWLKATITPFNPNFPNTSPGFGIGYAVTLLVPQKPSINLRIQASNIPGTRENVNDGQTVIEQSFKTSALKNATLEEGIVNLKQDFKQRIQPTIDLEILYNDGVNDMIIIRQGDFKPNVL